MQVIAQLPRNKDEALQVALAQYQGYIYVDIRRVWKPAGQSEFVPTKKGVTVRPDQVLQLIEALRKARDELAC